MFVGHQCYPNLTYFSHAFGTFARGLLSLSRTSGNTVGVSLIGAVFGGLIASVAAGADVSVAPPEAIVTGFQGTFRFATLILCVAATASVLRLRNQSK